VIVVQARHVIAAKASDVISTKTPNATAVEAAHVASVESTHVASAETTHVTTAEAATTVSSATTASASAASGLCTRGNKAAGKQRACQNHQHSSSHDILHLDGRIFRHKVRSDVGASAKQSQHPDGLEMGIPVRRLY
jgi:hypothetical protein